MTIDTAAAARLLANPGVGRILELLSADGEEARLVGGAIRNALMGLAAKDHDIATTAEPPVVLARAKAAGLRTVPTGLAHGTVTVLVGGRPFEVTTLREDVATDGRHAVIRFGRDFAVDALRRDFTINALSMGLDAVVHDYASGLHDIAAGRIRFIGDPATRIREDYLRILRFFRFSAEYAAGELDGDALAASIAARDDLARLSRERVRQELLKLLLARRAPVVCRVMSEAGLLERLLGGVPQAARLARLAAIAPTAGAMVRLAALGCQVTEDADRLRRALKLSNAETRILTDAATALCRLHGGIVAPPPRLLRELLFDIGRTGATDGLLLAWAESGASTADAAWHAALRFLHETPEPRLPFGAAELIAAGLKPGRTLGETLRRLQADWIRAGFPQEPRRLAALLASHLDGRPSNDR